MASTGGSDPTCPRPLNLRLCPVRRVRSLAQNYPNPFNHATHIGFTPPAAIGEVTLEVFNTHGQLVATLVEGTRPAGTYQTAWDGRDAQGQAVSSGVYIVRLDAGGQQATRKMLLMQ